MTARFRSAFFGSSGFVAVRPVARVVTDTQTMAPRRDHRGPIQGHALAVNPQSKGA